MQSADKLARRFALVAGLIHPLVSAQTFTFDPPKFVPLVSVMTAQGLMPLDLDGDGNTDIAVQLFTGNYVYLGDGKGGFGANPVYLSVNPFQDFSDLNGDGKADILIAYPGSYSEPGTPVGNFSVLLGDGKGNFRTTTNMELPYADTYTYVLGDFNNDGRPDVAYVDISADPADGETSLMIFLNMGNGVFKQVLHQVLEHYPFQIVAGDFNADGRTDLAWAEGQAQSSANTYRIRYMYGNGDGSFQPVRTYTLDAQPLALFAGDLNRDGRTDLGVAAPNAQGRFATLLAKQTSGFYWASNVNYPLIPNVLGLKDLNGDGQPDLLVAFSYVLLPGKPGGRFGAPQPLPVGLYYPLFVPLKKGGLPAIFDAFSPWAIRIFVNTSKK